jgi:hypothetical protein
VLFWLKQLNGQRLYRLFNVLLADGKPFETAVADSRFKVTSSPENRVREKLPTMPVHQIG